MQCINKVKQISLAALNYESLNNSFPMGLSGPWDGESWPRGDQRHENLGILPHLLSFVEASPVADRIEKELFRQDLKKQPGVTYQGYWTFPGASDMKFAKIPGFVCPSVAELSSAASWYPDSCIGSASVSGETVMANISTFGRTEPDLGPSHYLGVSGVYGEGVFGGRFGNEHPKVASRVGVYVNRKKRQMHQITDGASNTLAFGENNGGWSPSSSEYFVFMWIGATGMPVLRELATGEGPGGPLIDQFSSSHAGTVNFGMVDGSVHSLSEGIERRVLFALAGMLDGDVVNAEF